MIRTSLFVTASLLMISELSAQVVGGRQIVKADLVTAGKGKSYTVGIHFTIEPDWYLYWRNPGDAGLPISVRWNLPDGWKAGALRFPVPSKFVHDEIVSYGYKREAVLLCEITPSGTASGVIRADLDWLVCMESCVRGKATVSVQADAETMQPKSLMLEEAERRLPADGPALKVTLGSPIISHDDKRWTYEVPLEGEDSNLVTDFYPAENDQVFLDYGSIRVADHRLIFTFSRGDETKANATVNGLLMTGKQGYEYSVPVRFKSF